MLRIHNLKKQLSHTISKEEDSGNFEYHAYNASGFLLEIQNKLKEYLIKTLGKKKSMDTNSPVLNHFVNRNFILAGLGLLKFNDSLSSLSGGSLKAPIELFLTRRLVEKAFNNERDIHLFESNVIDFLNNHFNVYGQEFTIKKEGCLNATSDKNSISITFTYGGVDITPRLFLKLKTFSVEHFFLIENQIVGSTLGIKHFKSKELIPKNLSSPENALKSAFYLEKNCGFSPLDPIYKKIFILMLIKKIENTKSLIKSDEINKEVKTDIIQDLFNLKGKESSQEVLLNLEKNRREDTLSNLKLLCTISPDLRYIFPFIERDITVLESEMDKREDLRELKDFIFFEFFASDNPVDRALYNKPSFQLLIDEKPWKYLKQYYVLDNIKINTQGVFNELATIFNLEDVLAIWEKAKFIFEFSNSSFKSRTELLLHTLELSGINFDIDHLSQMLLLIDIYYKDKIKNYIPWRRETLQNLSSNLLERNEFIFSRNGIVFVDYSVHSLMSSLEDPISADVRLFLNELPKNILNSKVEGAKATKLFNDVWENNVYPPHPAITLKTNLNNNTLEVNIDSEIATNFLQDSVVNALLNFSDFSNLKFKKTKKRY